MNKFAIIGVTALMVVAVFLVSGYHTTTGMQTASTATGVRSKLNCQTAIGPSNTSPGVSTPAVSVASAAQD